MLQTARILWISSIDRDRSRFYRTACIGIANRTTQVLPDQRTDIVMRSRHLDIDQIDVANRASSEGCSDQASTRRAGALIIDGQVSDSVTKPFQS